MSFDISIPIIIFTWADERIKYATLNGSELPELKYSDSSKSIEAAVGEYIDDTLSSMRRVHAEQLNAFSVAGAKEILIPHIVLCRKSILPENFVLVDFENKYSLQKDRGFNSALKRLETLIGTSTACLNMLEDVFNNLHIRLIHNQVIGNVNRATLRKRFEDTGFVLPTGNKIQTKKGMPPNEMSVALQDIYFFGAHLSTTD